MKKVVALFTASLLLVCLSASCQKSNDNPSGINMEASADTKVSETEIALDENRIIPEQSFDVKLNDWGEVRFISYSPEAGADFEDVSFYLMKDNKVAYSFPYYDENNRTDNDSGLFDSVESVGFRDVNDDSMMDVIVIINYITGAGPQGMVPRPRARIFLADKTEFHLAKELTEDIAENMAESDLNINSIYEYLKNK